MSAVWVFNGTAAAGMLSLAGVLHITLALIKAIRAIIRGSGFQIPTITTGKDAVLPILPVIARSVGVMQIRPTY